MTYTSVYCIMVVAPLAMAAMPNQQNAGGLYERIQKIAALFLSFLLMTQLMLVPAVGEQTSNAAQSTEGSPTIQAPTMEEEELEPYAVGEEIEAWREEGVRHYYLGDGVYEAVVKAEKQSAGSDAKASSNTTTPSLGEPYETYISSSHPSTVYGYDASVYVGIAEIGLFWHEEPTLPENAVIVTAKLNFFYYYGISTGHMLVGAYPVNVTWNESDSWNSVQTKATNSGLPNMGIGTEKAGQIQLDASPTCTASNPTQTSVFVTTIVQSWYSGEYDNDGIALKRIALNDGEENNSVIIKPYEAEEEYWSYLTIQYRLADEDDGYIPEGDYFLQNVELGNYAQINDNVSPTTHGAIIEAWGFDGADDQKWRFTSLYNGYYKITSVASGYALTAPSSLNASITQTTFTNADNQHWKISVTADGYQLRPRSNYSYRLAVGDGIITGNGRNVEMRAVRTDHKDEWELIRIFDSTFVAIHDNGHAHDASFDQVNISLQRIGYTENRTIYELISTTCIDYIASSQIFYSRSHGSQTSIVLNNDSMSISDLNNFSSSYLRYCKLVVYGACYTGEGRENSNNLVNKTAEKGVATVIGFSDSVYCDEVNIWCIAFFQKLSTGETVEEACLHADSVVENVWTTYSITTDSWYIAGSKTAAFD